MLLADFHVHTTWSDGKLELEEVVDLFGRTGHDVVAITDHVVNDDCLLGKVAHRCRLSVTKDSAVRYLDALEGARRRAWDRWRMLLLSGFELTRNSATRDSSAHALALGVRDFISANGTVESMVARAKDHGAVVVAAHPHRMSDWYANTFYFWNRRRELHRMIDLWELACRWDLFPPVGRARLPFVGNSDFHEPSHLWAWKTVLDCEKTPEAVLATLRSGRGIGMTRLAHPWREDGEAPAVLPCGLEPSAA